MVGLPLHVQGPAVRLLCRPLAFNRQRRAMGAKAREAQGEAMARMKRDIESVRRRLIGRLSYTKVGAMVKGVRYQDLLDLLEFERAARMAAPAASPKPLELATGLTFQHVTTRGKPRTVDIHLVQAGIDGDEWVTLEYRETGYVAILPKEDAARWLADARPGEPWRIDRAQ